VGGKSPTPGPTHDIKHRRHRLPWCLHASLRTRNTQESSTDLELPIYTFHSLRFVTLLVVPVLSFYTDSMPELDTGRYTISNVRYGNMVVLPNANEGSYLIAESDPNEIMGKKVWLRPQCLWIVN
jgi:hypothetical protein